MLKKKLSCGHINFRGRLIDIPELSSSKGIEITPKESGVIPVTVSGDSGVKIEGFLDPRFNLEKVGGNFVVVNGPAIFNYESFQILHLANQTRLLILPP